MRRRKLRISVHRSDFREKTKCMQAVLETKVFQTWPSWWNIKLVIFYSDALNNSGNLHFSRRPNRRHRPLDPLLEAQEGQSTRGSKSMWSFAKTFSRASITHVMNKNSQLWRSVKNKHKKDWLWQAVFLPRKKIVCIFHFLIRSSNFDEKSAWANNLQQSKMTGLGLEPNEIENCLRR